MVNAIVTPVWETFLRRIDYVKPSLADLDGKSWIGTHRDYWLRSAEYMEELTGREDMSNMSDAYELLAENSRRIARGEAPQWAVDVLGYERARELEYAALVPNRGRWHVHEDGSEINRYGGIGDGDYTNWQLYLVQLFTSTFGIRNLGLIQTTKGGKWRTFTIKEQREYAEMNGLPLQEIEFIN